MQAIEWRAGWLSKRARVRECGSAGVQPSAVSRTPALTHSRTPALSDGHQRLNGPSNPGEVMVAVAHRVVFKDELRGQRSVGVERRRLRAVELRVAHLAN